MADLSGIPGAGVEGWVFVSGVEMGEWGHRGFFKCQGWSQFTIRTEPCQAPDGGKRRPLPVMLMLGSRSRDFNMRLSRKTLAAVARVLSEYTSHSDLDALAYEFGKEDSAVGSSRIGRCVSFIKALEKDCEEAGDDHPIIEIIERTLGLLNEWRFKNSPLVGSLVLSLQIDGFQYSNGLIIPTTPEPASLGPLLSQLERDLMRSGLEVAATHYSQACENLVAGNFEAANGQLRSFLENLFITVCEKASGRHFQDASAALQHLKQTTEIDVCEWNTFRGLWESCQSNGPHHGLSNNEEAIYRLHMVTAIARYLLYKSQADLV